jgi:autotransporter strand-loop-strand O-heptosyltransferase
MPYSFTYFKEEVKEWFLENVPTSKRILDVGPGIGTYSDLLRSLGYRMDAVEIYEPYIEKYGLREKYDNVFIGSIVTFDIKDYDFIILGDVLEHIPTNYAKELIRDIVNAKKECLVAIPYEMEQGEHEGNIHETHYQPDLTHEVMGERYPELSCIYRNEYYGYYTHTHRKEEKMYVLYANASYHSVVCMAVESIKKVSDIPVLVYMLDDYKEVPGAYTVWWKCDVEDIPKGTYIDRNKSDVYKLLIQRPLIVKDALERFAKTVCYVDSDSVATRYVDRIFNYYPTSSEFPYFTEGIYDYLLINGRGVVIGRENLHKSLEAPACELFGIDQSIRQKYRQTGYFVAGQNTIPFLDEWSWMCNHPEVLKNPQYYAPYHEETIVNVLLWKHKFLDGLPYIYVNASLDKLDRIYNEDNWGSYLESWFKLPESEDQLFFLHGEKDPVAMSKIMSKLPSKMSNPLRILFLAPHLSTGGMPQFLLKRIQALKDSTDVEIFVVEYQCHSLDFVVQRDQIMDIVPVHTLYEDKMELFTVIDHFKPDVIHIDEMSERLNRDMVIRLYSDNRSYRIVETCHDVSFVPETKMFIPDAFAFCSPYHLDTFASVDGYKQVIEYPIEFNFMGWNEKVGAQSNLGMDLTKKHVVNIGLWTRGKNQGEGLEVARQMPDVHFHFVGNQAGNFIDYWEPLMENIPENVTVWGERIDAHVFMKAADVFMFNSTWECNPLVIREAISYGKSILARNLPQYKDMFTNYITDLDPTMIASQIRSLLETPANYPIPTNNTSLNFANANLNLYKHAVSTIPHKNNIKDWNITQHFVGQPFLEITGTSTSDFTVEFYDGPTLVYHDNLKCNHWVKLAREYYTNWRTVVYKDGEKVYDKLLNLDGKRVYISFESSSLGDTIAWMPYVEEFRCAHNCDVVVSTFKNFLFESEYPMLEFVEPGTNVTNLYAMYKLGWFYNENKEPELPNTIPLQKAATNILGLPYKEIKPRITYKTRPQHPDDKYVAIATNSTAGCKFWTRENWQEIINYLHTVGYSVVNTSLEDNPFDNCAVLYDKSMENTIDCIVHSQFFIGLSSGLSWLAWGLNKEVIMISNFTDANHEFQCHRPVNTNVCHGCWNDPQYTFDKGDWDWCPVHKGTERQFECQKSVTPRMVIDEIKKLLK